MKIYCLIVIVISPTVSDHNDLDNIKLGQGEKTSSTKRAQDFNKSNTADPNFDAWSAGKLQFNHTELGRVPAILEDYYGISFMVKDDELLACLFAGKFENKQTGESTESTILRIRL